MGEKVGRREKEINSESKQTPIKLLSSAASKMHPRFYEPVLDHNCGLGSKRWLFNRASHFQGDLIYIALLKWAQLFLSPQKTCPFLLLNLILLLWRWKAKNTGPRLPKTLPERKRQKKQLKENRFKSSNTLVLASVTIQLLQLNQFLPQLLTYFATSNIDALVQPFLLH